MTDSQISLPVSVPTPGTGRSNPGPADGGEAAAGPARLPRVIGLDLSLTATGVAPHDGAVQTIRTSPGDHLADQHDRLTYIVTAALSNTDAHTALAVIEGPSYGSSGIGTWDRAGLWWLVVAGLFAQAIPVAVVPPSVLKRYATGKGNATKPDMRMALYQRTGINERDDNKVDAWWLRAMGLDHLGHPPVDLPKVHREALTKLTWPEVSR